MKDSMDEGGADLQSSGAVEQVVTSKDALLSVFELMFGANSSHGNDKSFQKVT